MERRKEKALFLSISAHMQGTQKNCPPRTQRYEESATLLLSELVNPEMLCGEGALDFLFDYNKF